MPMVKTLHIAGLALLAAAAGSPASAQSDRGVTEEIIRGVERAAESVVAVDDALRRAGRNVRFRGAERFAVEACERQAERYGRIRIDDVERYKRRSWRVYGIADPGSGYDRRSRYDSRYDARRFTCTVRDDGRVTKFKTKRIRY
jgi:hypothetical protein